MQINNAVLDIRQRPKIGQWFFLSLQHVFAMFGATILVPALTGLSPAVALISSGISTLAFIAITNGKVPSYLGSSFAFITPIITAKAFGGYSAILIGSLCVAIIYSIVALLIRLTGTKLLIKILPPVVVGPIIIVIGLSLASTAINMISNHNGQYDLIYLLAGFFTLGLTIIFAIFLRGFLSVIPVLLGIIGGYVFCIFLGMVDITLITNANWFAIPDFAIPFYSYSPNWSFKAILLIAPVAIVPIAEHIGHQLVLSKVINKNLINDPGLDRSLFADGVGTFIASLIGAPPNTTYGENIGVLAITRAYSIYLFIGAALFAITFGFCGKIAAILTSIPTPVMGGVAILLFGIIASSGLRMIVENNIDFSKKRNLVIASVILVIGIGGGALHIGENFVLEGMALASIIGVILNLILPGKEVIDFEQMFK